MKLLSSPKIKKLFRRKAPAAASSTSAAAPPPPPKNAEAEVSREKEKNVLVSHYTVVCMLKIIFQPGTTSSLATRDDSLPLPGPSGPREAEPAGARIPDVEEEDEPFGDATEEERARFYRLLEKTRRDAVKTRKYDSTAVRVLMAQECFTRIAITPREWQLDIAEAILLGLDTVLMAGTGSGKTLPFVLPLLADKKGLSKIIIVSTLNELEKDQVRRFWLLYRSDTVTTCIYSRVFYY